MRGMQAKIESKAQYRDVSPDFGRGSSATRERSSSSQRAQRITSILSKFQSDDRPHNNQEVSEKSQKSQKL